jgi:hypothetical protein
MCLKKTKNVTFSQAEIISKSAWLSFIQQVVRGPCDIFKHNFSCFVK